MALNELKGVSISEFTINNNPGGGFTALVTVNNSQYEGRGNSKVAAKNNACEKALRDFIIAKLRENPRHTKGSSCNNSVCNEPMDTSDDNTQNSNNNALDDSDDVPMVNLASFAIYKLFSEWENEGFVIPELHPTSSGGGNASDNEGSTAGKEPKKVTIRNELPPNWEAMHPASLLCVVSFNMKTKKLYVVIKICFINRCGLALHMLTKVLLVKNLMFYKRWVLQLMIKNLSPQVVLKNWPDAM